MLFGASVTGEKQITPVSPYQKFVVSVVSDHFPNSIRTTCCIVVGVFLTCQQYRSRQTAVSLTSSQQTDNFPPKVKLSFLSPHAFITD